jgi:hypothetical protein
MRKSILALIATAIVAATGVAVADLAVKDGSGTNQVMFDFICFTTKHCSSVVLVNSAGVEIQPATHADAIAPIAPGSNLIGYTSADPCAQGTGKVNVNIATSSGTFQAVAPSGVAQVYVCSFSLVAAATAVVNLVGGTGGTCTTGTPVAALGSTTAASGMSLAANGGLTYGNGGASVARTTTAGHGLCLIQSGTAALAGNLTYVQQ